MNQLSDEEFAKLFRTPPADAVAAWERRNAKIVPTNSQLKRSEAGVPSPEAKWAYQDVLWNAHSRGFFVARVAQADVLQTIHSHMDKAIKEGWSYQKFQRSLKPELQAKGWWSGTKADPEGKVMTRNPKTGQDEMTRLGTPRRLRIIYDTNMAVSYAAGHYQQLKESANLLPWWRYVAIMDKSTRPAHAALHNHVYTHDDPAWGSIFPPNGWRCRCRVEPLTEREAHGTEGYTVQKQSQTVTEMRRVGKDGPMVPVTGVVAQDGRVMFPDPAWAYNPGQYGHAVETLAWERVKKLPEPAQKAFVNSIARDQGLANERSKGFEAWMQSTLGMRDARRVSKDPDKTRPFSLGWLDGNVLPKVAKHSGIPDLSPIITIDETQAYHATRSSKPSEKELSVDEMLDLPTIIANAWGIDWDPGEKNLRIYSVPFVATEGEHKGKRITKSIIVRLPEKGKDTMHFKTTQQDRLDQTGKGRLIPLARR